MSAEGSAVRERLLAAEEIPGMKTNGEVMPICAKASSCCYFNERSGLTPLFTIFKLLNKTEAVRVLYFKGQFAQSSFGPTC